LGRTIPLRNESSIRPLAPGMPGALQRLCTSIAFFFVAVIYSDFILFAQLFLMSNFYMFKITQNMH